VQVQATFAGGLAEHLQAAGGASASIAASLRESVSQMSSATERLNTQASSLDPRKSSYQGCEPPVPLPNISAQVKDLDNSHSGTSK